MLTLISFIFFTALVGLITWVMTKEDNHDSSSGYFLGGRSLTGGFIAGSLMLTNLSTEQLVGLNGAAYSDGLLVMAWEVLSAIALTFMALYFLPKYLKSGITTIPQLLEERYDKTTRLLVTIIFIVAYSLILLPIILYTGAIGMISILDLKTLTGIESSSSLLWMTVWFVGIIGSVYAIFGGLRSVAVSDTLNGFGLLFGGLLITVFALMELGGNSFGEGVTKLLTEHPEKMNSIGGSDSALPLDTLFSGVMLLVMFYWCTNQQIIQRTFGASTLKEGQKGVIYAGFLKILAPLILVLPGIIAFHLYGETELKADQAYGHLVQNVLPTPLTGFFAAALAGAILSSFNSALNSACTLFSLGFYKSVIAPQAEDEKVISAGKKFGFALAVFSMTLAPLLAGQDSIFGYLQKMNGLYAIPIFAVVIMGLVNSRVPSFAAVIALLLGLVTISLGYFIPALATIVDEEIGGFHFLGLVFIGLVAFLYVASLVAPNKEPWIQQDSGAVDLTPWPLAKPLSLFLIGVTLVIYFIFADFSVL